MNLRRLKTFVLAALLLIGAGFVTAELTKPAIAQQLPSPSRDNSGDNESSEDPGLVSIDGKPIFTIQAKLGPFSREARAKNVERKISSLLEDPEFKVESISLNESDTTIDVISADTIITSITDKDAKLAGVEKQELARKYMEGLKEALLEAKAKRTVSGALEEVNVKKYGQGMLHILLTPSFIKFAIVALGSIIFLGMAAVVKKSLGHYVKDSNNRYNARKIVTFAGYCLCVLFAMVVFRDALGNLTVIIGAAAAGIAFALKEVIVSIAGWVAITFGDFYKVGDRVRIGSIKGDIIDIGLGRTTLMELGEWVKGDLYTGRIVRVDNSVVFSSPMFNYSRDFPFLWDEIVIPVKYGSDYDLAYELLTKAADDVCGDYSKEAGDQWQNITRKYLVEHAQTEPMITYVFNDNWVEFTLRYVVDYKKRRSTRFDLSKRILKDFEANGNRLGLASATFQLVEAPPLEVNLVKGS